MLVFSKIIDALSISYHKANQRQIVKPVQLHGTFEQQNILIRLDKGFLYVGNEYKQLPEGGFYFIPAGQPIFIKHGRSDQYILYGSEGFETVDERERFIKPYNILHEKPWLETYFTIIGFDAQLYDAINIFAILDLPAFTMEPDAELNYLITNTVMEEVQDKIGRDNLIRNYTEEIVIRIARNIDARPEFRRNIEKLDFLLDKRLVNIVQYIQQNLERDLSNSALADVAFVSEDYVGQFFKSMTNKNLQEYIENQRLDRAHYLLRTRNDSIQEIAHLVGFKDPAYFSRRFKIKYGQNANALRRDKDQV